MKHYTTPQYLKAGDTVTVLAAASAPAGSYARPDAQWIPIMESWGLKVKFGKHLYDCLPGDFAGTDAERAADITEALLDDEVKAIISFRGGYGSMRTCMNMDLNLFKEHPKWLVGFSDITIFHAALQKMEIESLHGPMPFSYGKSELSQGLLLDALFGRKLDYHIDPHPFNRPGKAKGRLVGGNLALYNSTLNTPWANELDEPCILFLEDIEESMHTIDRMLLSMRAGGWLQKAKGVIIGQFTDIAEEGDWARTAYELIKEHTDTLDCPVMFGMPSGHEQPNYPLIMGREVSLEVGPEGGHLEFLK
jgi:Uncharacterized proteins, homologs of microcin C7 resistance protein MccF